MSKIAAIIAAAGSGTRIGGPVKKQFISIHGKPLLQYTLEVFQNCKVIDEIVVVGPTFGYEELENTIKFQWNISKLRSVVAGGDERYISVFNGLNVVSSDVEWIAIHDGVRPFVSAEKIINVVKAAKLHGAAILAVKPKDTIKVNRDGFVKDTLDRDSLALVQTPQVFSIDLLRRAYDKAVAENLFGTDDAYLVEQIGSKVAIVEGDYSNIKITSPEDLLIAEKFIG